VSTGTGAAPAAPNPYVWMTARGWRLLAVKARGKEPLTPHGVKDATIDMATIVGWYRRWPDMNIAVACGAPGPQVLDIDNPTAIPAALMGKLSAAPRVATARGGHVYFAGTDQGTIKLEFGELRGRGSYVLVPPSIHPSGKAYTWLSEPRGPLPQVPALVVRSGQRVGCGEHEPPPRPIIAGEGRHPYMHDFVVRLLRAGVTDRKRIAEHARLEFSLSCEPVPAPKPGYFEAWAEWAVRTLIAQRERSRNGR
jgi:Bifunctional DNA primase/polymerase, N-terminal